MSIQRLKGKILEPHIIHVNGGDDMCILHIHLNDKLDWIPGQFVTIHRMINDELIKRSYSIVTISSLNILEICFNIVNDGKMTPCLSQAESEIVDIIGPFGQMLLNLSKKRKVFIATGTGVAPFISMINQSLDLGCEVVLICSNKLYDQAVYNGLLSFIYETETDKFTYIPTLTRDTHESMKSGRVTDFLEDVYDETHNTEYYICGMKDMIDSVLEFLSQKNVSGDDIVVEQYDKN